MLSSFSLSLSLSLLLFLSLSIGLLSLPIHDYLHLVQEKRKFIPRSQGKGGKNPTSTHQGKGKYFYIIFTKVIQINAWTRERRPQENVCRCNHESNQIKKFNFRWTNFVKMSITNDGWPGPGCQGQSIPYYKPTQIRTKLVYSLLLLVGRVLENFTFLAEIPVSKQALLATHDLGFLENPAPLSWNLQLDNPSGGFVYPSIFECLLAQLQQPIGARCTLWKRGSAVLQT